MINLRLKELFTDRRFRYLFVGGINTAFGFIFFTSVYLAFEEEFNYLAIFIFCQIVAVLFSHSMQRKFVWRSELAFRGELLKFGITFLVISLINILLLAVAKEMFNFSVLVSQYTIGFSLILATYFVQKKWVFKSDN